MQHGRVAAEVGVVVFQHLGVIGGQAHEDQQTDGAEHKVFGRGEVLKVKPAAGDQIVEIRFEKVGVKKTMANYAPLVKITTEE